MPRFDAWGALLHSLLPHRAGRCPDLGCGTGTIAVLLARHVLWALPDPAAALRRWTGLLRPGGRLVLIDGRWATGAGIVAADCRTLVLGERREALVERLDDPALRGARHRRRAVRAAQPPLIGARTGPSRRPGTALEDGAKLADESVTCRYGLGD